MIPIRSLFSVLMPFTAVAQTPGWNWDLGSSYGWYPTPSEQTQDNLLDQDRNAALTLSCSYLHTDTLPTVSFSWGGGGGMVLWEGVPLASVTIGGALYITPDALRHIRWPYIRGEFGMLFGPWLHTDRGQLHGSTIGIGVMGLRVTRNVHVEVGFMNLTAKGPYVVSIDQQEEERDASFTYITGGLRVSF